MLAKLRGKGWSRGRQCSMGFAQSPRCGWLWSARRTQKTWATLNGWAQSQPKTSHTVASTTIDESEVRWRKGWRYDGTREPIRSCAFALGRITVYLTAVRNATHPPPPGHDVRFPSNRKLQRCSAPIPPCFAPQSQFCDLFLLWVGRHPTSQKSLGGRGERR
jgi:hypothetical protein